MYTLFEIYNSQELTDPNQIIDNKVTLLEHLTSKLIDKSNVKEDILEEFKSYDKDLRILTYRVILEKFNDKYSSLNLKQKRVLKEFINSIDSTTHLREFYNNEIVQIKSDLKSQISKTKDQTIKIKLQEVIKYITELDKKSSIKSDNLVDLLQYHSLLEELATANG